jgi:Ca-activated chloride channel family protein
MINYFDYNLQGPRKGDPVNIMTELSHTPWNTQHQLLRISLKAKNIPTANLPTSNFVFLIDISGSMSSPNKLPLVKSSFKLLIDQLRPQDKVAIVTYAGNANVALESTSGDKKMKIKEVIDGLQAGGSTAGGDGLKMAYNIARQNFVKNGNNRVIMATDGDFNVGSSSDSDMEKLISNERESNVNISVLGYGMGNYKDSKLETLANKGRGNYAYINDISEARKAIVTEFGGTMFTVAKDVKIQVEFNPKYVQAYRLVGYENRVMAAEDFNNDAKVGGDMGVGHSVTALYEIVPVGVNSTIIGSIDPLKYQENKKRNINNNSTELATIKFRYKDPNADKSKLQEHVVGPKALSITQASTDFRFISAVAELGMLLRNSDYKQNANFDQLIQRAKEAKGKDDEGYRAEFIRLAEDAKALVKSEDVAIR